jgi:hypothetical protein
VDFSKIKIAKTQETITENFLGVDLVIARGGNPLFKKKFSALTKPYNHQIQNGTLSEEKSSELLAKSMACTVLVDWSGFSVDGEDLPFTESNAAALLENDNDCREFVLEVSANFSKFLVEAEDDIQKK